MKIQLYILLAFLLVSQNIWSQCETNGTLTDVQNPSPQGAGYRTNTFDWQEPQLPIQAPTSMPTIQQRLSIFYSNEDWHVAIADNTFDNLRDFHPEDGWELIKQDLGYLYDASASPEWQGLPIPAGGLQHPNTGTWLDATTLPYIIMYNKYSAKLRVIGLYKKYAGYQHIKIKVAFDKYNGEFETPVSALFDIYNSPEIQPLDQQTKIDNIEALAKFDDLEWFYADFPMAYDACTCEFDTRLEVSFWGIEEAQITATGRILGTAIPITDINGNSDYLMGDQFSDQFFTSFYDDRSLTPDDLDQMVGNYKDAIDLAKEVSTRTGDPDVLGSVIKGIDLALSITKAIPVFGGISTVLQTPGKALEIKNIANGVGAANGILGKGVSFYKSLNSKPKATTTKPMAISAQLVLQGKSLSTDLFDEVKIANPGSQNALTFDEYPISQDPMYPMYNEVMGHFNLVHTPKYLYIEDRQDESCNDPRDGYPPGRSLKVDQIFQIDPSSISYVLNPIINAELSSFLVALELEGYDAGGVQVQELTPFVPLECAGAYFSNNSFRRGQCRDNFGSVLRVKRLVFSNTYVFQPDQNGNIAVSSEILKFPIEKEVINQIPNGIELNSLPTNLNLGTQTINGGTNIYSYGTITISGHLSYSGTGLVYIRASEKIELAPGAIVDPNIILEISAVPNCSAPKVYPKHMSRADCLNDEFYKADNIVHKKEEIIHPSSKLPKLTPLYLHPNPAQNTVYIDGVQVTEIEKVMCLDALGRVVHEWKGYSENLDVSMLHAGVYLIKVYFQDGKASETKKLSIRK